MKKNAEKIRKLGVFLTICVSAAVMVGCGKGQESEETEKLTVCTGSMQEYEVRKLVEAWQTMNDGIETEMIVVPSDDTLAETKITELRTEIMSGGGPDVFIMPCDENTEKEDAPELFPNPEKAMYSDLFLPLDDYISDAQYMDPDGWNQTIMDSGKTEEGQVLLPLTYRYYAYVFRTADLENPENLPESWEELISDPDPMFGEFMSYEARELLPYTFGKLADYQEEKLLFSEEELQERVDEAFTWKDKTATYQMETQPIAQGKVEKAFCEAVDYAATEEETAIALPNDQGGITAYVTVYAAINRNTEKPDQAFSLLDFLFSDEIMTGDGFPGEDPLTGIGKGCNPPDNFNGGISVNLKAAQKMSRNQVTKDLLEQMDRRINEVRYYSNLENEIYWMVYKCLARDKDSAPPLSAEERREVIHRTYEEMEMQMAE